MKTKKTIKTILTAATLAVMMTAQLPAQGLRGLGGALKKATEKAEEVKSKASEAKEKAGEVQAKLEKNAPGVSSAGTGASENNGPSLYVSVSTGAGSRTADGSKEKPYKDLQAAIDAAPEGAVVRVAEGNYLGKMEQGFVEVKKYITVEGGWNTSFTERDYVKYPTMIQPTGEHSATAGDHGLIDVIVKGNPAGVVIIDGLIFDMSKENMYIKAPNSESGAACPEGCETGRIVLVGEGPNFPFTDGASVARQCMYGHVQGKLIVRNCMFSNAYHYGIQMENGGGHWEICNNVFVACRMAGCEVRSNNARPETETTLAFHHNTVLFTWCRDKIMEDMGYGFRYMTGMNYDVYDNIFGVNNYAALDRTRFDSDLKRDKLRKTNAWDNIFFANRMGDICLPSGGGKWNFQYARNFEEVEQLERYEGNREANASEIEALGKAINGPYLKAFLGLRLDRSSQYNENSAMNTARAAFGMNKQGSETIRVNMYCNRYPFAETGKLWSIIPGKGAQAPKQ